MSESQPSIIAMHAASADWLLKRRHEDLSLTFRTAWDLYIKFYTVFLTVSITALIFVAGGSQFLKAPQGNPPGGGKTYTALIIVVVFSVQSAICAVTSVLMGLYSKKASKDQASIESRLVSTGVEVPGAGSTIPVGLAQWAGFANAVVMCGLIVIWCYLLPSK